MVKKTSINLNIFVVDALLFIYIIKSSALVSSTEILQRVLDCLDLPILLILFICVMLSHLEFNLKQLIKLSIGVIIVLITYLNTGYAEFLRGFLLIITIRSCNYKKILYSMRKTIIFSITLIFLLYIIGISNAGTLRRGALSLGFSNATILGLLIMLITLISLVIDTDMTANEKWLLAILNILSFALAGSRTSTILALFAIFVSNFDLPKLFTIKIVKIGILLLPLICLLLSVGTAELYPSKSFVQMLDPITNYRISLNYRNIQLVGITPFGSNIGYVSKIERFYNSVTKSYSTFNTIDNAYVMGLLEMGIASMAVWYFIYTAIIRKNYTYQKYNLILAAVLLSVYGLLESSILNFLIMFPFLLLLNNFHELEVNSYTARAKIRIIGKMSGYRRSRHI